jgi:hypothetical protein
MMSAYGLASCVELGVSPFLPSLSWAWAYLDKLPQNAPTCRIHSILSFFAHFFDW